jgi:hypothetical protein
VSTGFECNRASAALGSARHVRRGLPRSLPVVSRCGSATAPSKPLRRHGGCERTGNAKKLGPSVPVPLLIMFFALSLERVELRLCARLDPSRPRNGREAEYIADTCQATAWHRRGHGPYRHQPWDRARSEVDAPGQHNPGATTSLRAQYANRQPRRPGAWFEACPANVRSVPGDYSPWPRSRAS